MAKRKEKPKTSSVEIRLKLTPNQRNFLMWSLDTNNIPREIHPFRLTTQIVLVSDYLTEQTQSNMRLFRERYIKWTKSEMAKNYPIWDSSKEYWTKGFTVAIEYNTRKDYFIFTGETFKRTTERGWLEGSCKLYN